MVKGGTMGEAHGKGWGYEEGTCGKAWNHEKACVVRVDTMKEAHVVKGGTMGEACGKG